MSAGEGPVTLRMAAAPAALPVARRVVGALGARADLPLDRLEDAMMLAEALALHGPARSPGRRACLRLVPSPGHLAISVGPLPSGAGTQMVADSAVDGVGPLIERLADRVAVRPDGDGEYLDLDISAGS